MAESPAEALLGETRDRRSQPPLDGLRGIAVLILFTSAAWRASGQPDYEISFGIGHLSFSPFLAMGDAVDWFFVLSAYLVARPFVAAGVIGRSRPSVRTFLRRRAIRIYPAFWLILIMLPLVLTPWLAEEASVYSIRGFVALFTTLTGFGTLFPWAFGRWFAFGPLWTITHHLLIFLLVPPVAYWLARRRPLRAVTGLLATSAIVSAGWLWMLRSPAGDRFARAFGDAAGTVVDGPDLGRVMLFNQFPTFLPDVAFGLALALVAEHAVRRPDWSARLAAKARPMMIAGVVISFVGMWSMGSIALERGFTTDVFAVATDGSGGAALFVYGRHAMMGLGFALVLAAVVFGRRSRRVLGNRWLRCVGILGFGIYLVHGPVLYGQSWLPWLAEIDAQLRLPAAWLLGATSTIGIALIMWFGLERRVLSARPGHAPVTAVAPTGPIALDEPLSPVELVDLRDDSTTVTTADNAVRSAEHERVSTGVTAAGTEASTADTAADSSTPRGHGVVDRWLLGRSERNSRGLSQLDGVRGVAVLMVLLTHAWGFGKLPRYEVPGIGFPVGHLFSAAASGVTLFFVLSGFLLSRRFLERQHDGLPRGPLTGYFRDRAVRILPLYWVLLAVFALLMVPWITKADAVHSHSGFAAFVPYVFALSTLFSWSYQEWFVITPVWTLTVEVAFYAVLPFVAWRFAGTKWRRALGTSLGVSLAWLFILRWSTAEPIIDTWGSIGDVALGGLDFGRVVLSTQLPAFAFAFAIGIAIASVDVQRRRAIQALARPSWYRFLVPAGTAFTALVLWYVGELQVDRGFSDSFVTVSSTSIDGLMAYYVAPNLQAVGFGLVVAGLVLDGRRHRLMESDALRAFGVLGYSIYLWHFPVMFSQQWLGWLDRMSPQLRAPVTFVLGTVTAVIISLLTWFAIERPLITWNRRRAQPIAPGLGSETASKPDLGAATGAEVLLEASPSP